MPDAMPLKFERDDDDTREVIHLETLAKRRHVSATRWGMMLVTMMRLASVLWFLLGLTYWMRILAPGSAPLDALPSDAAVAIVFFAVAHPAAAVGLWLAAPWGGVLWLLAAVAEMAASWFMPAYIQGGFVVWMSYITLILIYVLFTWLAAQEQEQF